MARRQHRRWSAHFLALNRCPHGFEAISIDDENGGVRLTPGKCCGRWDVVKRWPMTTTRWRELVNTIECEIESDEE